MKEFFKEFKNDLPASIIVFFVAVPLCLGIALASGAPLFAGIIAGIVGGIVVGSASGSTLGVSGPAAGLAVIVLSAIGTLGSWEAFLLAVIFAGFIQLLAGYLKLGMIAYYFPSSVIKGMLAGIGLLIILKQIPHAFGYDADYEGDLNFNQPDGENTFSEILHLSEHITPAAVIITLISMFILILWDVVLTKKHKIFGILSGPLVAVFVGIAFTYLSQAGLIDLSLNAQQVVNIPIADSIPAFFNQFSVPDFSQWNNPEIYLIGFVMAVVASLETLLCVEATDKIDPDKRITPTNRELKAQGLGNIVSGFIGGLPITQVIVRSSANIAFGGKTKLSAILHGFFLLLSAIALPGLLNMIPLATLAAILFIVGFKLAKPVLFKQMYKLGWEQFVPFVVTIVAILLSDLLKGIGIGMAVAIFFLLRNNFRNAFQNPHTADLAAHEYRIVLAEEVTFLNKGSILDRLNKIPANSRVVIDGTKSKFIHYDVKEIIDNYKIHAEKIGVTLELVGFEEIQTSHAT